MSDERSLVPCPTCGEPVEPRQLVCLNCGERVALRRRRSVAEEPMAPIAAFLVVVIVIGAGLFGFAISEITSDESQVAADAGSAPRGRAPSVVSGEGQERGRSRDLAPAEPGASSDTAPARPGATGTAPATPAEPRTGPNALLEWPKDLTAYTAVLVTSSDRVAARDVARQARRSGLEAGLLRAEDYNLGAGLWIVFSGRFDTREGAARQATQLDDRYEGAYPQLVRPVR